MKMLPSPLLNQHLQMCAAWSLPWEEIITFIWKKRIRKCCPSDLNKGKVIEWLQDAIESACCIYPGYKKYTLCGCINNLNIYFHKLEPCLSNFFFFWKTTFSGFLIMLPLVRRQETILAQKSWKSLFKDPRSLSVISQGMNIIRWLVWISLVSFFWCVVLY